MPDHSSDAPLRLINVHGRAALDIGGRVLDVEQASGGRFDADPMGVIREWDAFRAWAATVPVERASGSVESATLGVVVPRPAKVFGIALNYRRHAEETGAQVPDEPSVFTKFPSCLAAPTADVVLPSPFVDWEVELVAVMGRGGVHISESAALDHVAGFCVGQDYSERRLQMAGTRPQFSLAKSFDSFGPIGPALVSLDAFDDPNDVALRCEINGEVVQDSRTSDLIFSVPALVSYLSNVCTLEPGDLIFTGTPSGVGVARTPQRFLAPGDVVVSTIDEIGSLRNVARNR